MTDDDLLERHEERLGEMSKQFATLARRVTDLEAELEAKDERIEELEEVVSRFRDIGAQKTSKEEKIAAFVTFADRMRDPNQEKYTLSTKQMVAAAGIKRRYAYELLDDLSASESYPWLKDAADLPTAPDQERRQRGLLVDFGFDETAVQRDVEPLSKFNNAIGGVEGSA